MNAQQHSTSSRVSVLVPTRVDRMTVFINARFLCQRLSGVQRFAGEIWNALDQQLDADPVLKSAIGPLVALRPPGDARAVRWRNISLRIVGSSGGHVWEQGALFRSSRDGVLVSLGNTGPMRHPAHILALHDANIWDIPQAFSPSYRLLHRLNRPSLARRAKRLITVSDFSANRLSTCLDIPQSRFVIIPNGADHIEQGPSNPFAIHRYGLKRDGYLLCVGNQSPNKNIGRLIQAHASAGVAVPPLVIVGGTISGLEAELQKTTNEVRVLGRVDDGTLRSLYEGALGFVFPSLYEGFGMPPLEAMQVGTPVLAANRTAMPEILKNAPLWFDPTDVVEMSKVMIQFANLPKGERANMVRRGKDVAEQFTWTRSASLLVQQILSLKASISGGVLDVPHRNTASSRKVS